MGSLPLSTTGTPGLCHLDEAPPSHHVPVPLRGNHWLGLWARAGQVPSTLDVCFQSKKKLGSPAGNSCPPPSPFLFSPLPHPCTFPQHPPQPQEVSKVTTCGPKSNPCPQASAGTSPRSPTFLLQLRSPATLLTPAPAIPLCGQLSKCSQTSPFSPQPPENSCKKSAARQVLLQSLAESNSHSF